jgi:glycosyltransferase involved in cell wall biosynthesis
MCRPDSDRIAAAPAFGEQLDFAPPNKADNLPARAKPEEMKSPADNHSPLAGCTIAYAATMPQARVLAKSFRQFHPGAKFFILLIDRPDEMSPPPHINLLGLRDLALAAGEEWRLPMLYDSQELASLLEPALLLKLLEQGATTLAYFECSTCLFGPVTSLELPDGDNAVVASESIDNNLGDGGRSFIAVRSGAEASLQSWSDRLRNAGSGSRSGAQGDPLALESLFDEVPHRVTTTPGFAIAYWNLDAESFTLSAHGYQTGGQPLRSFDFRGYDPAKPHLLSRHQGLEPRILLSQYPALAQFCDEYRKEVLGVAAVSSQPRGPRIGVLPSGLRIDHRMVGLYRDELQKWRAGEISEPPSPFGPGGEEAFVKWLNEPMGKTEKRVTRYMLAVREDREDVKNAFPDPLGTDAAGFRDWYLLFGRHELDLPAAVLPATSPRNDAADAARAASDLAATPVNVAGYFRAELGIGVAARSLLSALEAAGIPFNPMSFDATANRQSYPFVDRTDDTRAADINIVCVNPDQLSVFAEQTGPELRTGRYTIGVWFWEVEDFPKLFHGAFNYVDEIWVASDFMRETFLKVSPKAVFKFRLPVLTPEIEPSLSRADLGLPRQFVFLFSFDLLSVLERKNPIGLIKAFTTAFSNGEGPVLVIKTINGDKRALEMEKLRYAIRGRSDIILKDGYLSQIETGTLTALSDCYVSLHRSEGFGLTIAEAIALGKPVIATAYSGNLDFMTAENSYLCPARRVEVGPEREPYPATSHWSEPDIGRAAQLLRQVYTHPEEAGERGLQGAEDIRTLYSPAVAGPLLRDRLAEIRRRRK